SRSTTYRSAAYTELAKLYLNEKQYNKAIVFANKALQYNQSNVVALDIQAVSQRLSAKPEIANNLLSRLYNLDNTSAFVAFERTLINEKKSTELSSLITNELKTESYIDLALKYYNFGLKDESISALKASPKDAKVFL